MGLLLGACEAKTEVIPQAKLSVITQTVAGQDFRLEVASTSKQTQLGLMARPSMGANEGMLFVFGDVRERFFVMENCLFDLDIVFLDPKGKIVSVRTMLAPPHNQNHYPSGFPAQFAIEFNRGTASRLGLEAGHVIDLPIESLLRRVE